MKASRVVDYRLESRSGLLKAVHFVIYRLKSKCGFLIQFSLRYHDTETDSVVRSGGGGGGGGGGWIAHRPTENDSARLLY